jgi:acyl carrier protein
MQTNQSQNLEILTDLIRDVKPSLADSKIGPDDSLVENLGLDSLDVVQLARKLRRIIGASFDPQLWTTNHLIHKYSVSSLLEAMQAGAAAGKRGTPPSPRQTLTA